MRKNEPNAADRVASPIAFHDLDGQLLKGQTFETASGEVFVYRSDTNDWVAATGDAVEIGGVGESGLYLLQLEQSEVDYDTIVGVKLHSAAATSGAITTTITTGGGNAVYTRAGPGDFTVDGFRVGHVVDWTGFVADGNNVTGAVITALTSSVMTVVLSTQSAEGPTVATTVTKETFADHFWWEKIDTGAAELDAIRAWSHDLGVTFEGLMVRLEAFIGGQFTTSGLVRSFYKRGADGVAFTGQIDAEAGLRSESDVSGSEP